MEAKKTYSVSRCLGYMLRTAWRSQKGVPFMCVLLAAVELGLNLAHLYVAPQILTQVENHVPVTTLLATIAGFTGLILLLTTLKNYLGASVLYQRIAVRSAMVVQIVKKQLTTSYPNTVDPAFQKLLEGAQVATGGNNRGTEHIWTTLTALLASIGGFVVYVLLLSEVNLWLLAILTATTLIGFFMEKRAGDASFRNQEKFQKVWQQMDYFVGRSESVELAKDIRIFGLAGWVKEINLGLLRVHQDLTLKENRTYLVADLTNVALTVLRNGLAYVYLINLVLSGGLSAPAFLLYFTAVSGFTQWVTGILREYAAVRKECKDIAVTMEFLDAPEPFKFAGGKEIPKAKTYELRLDHVSFHYPGAEKNLFTDLNLTIRPGEKLAVVGLNGAGKTTLVKLLCGFYDPDEGRVLLNGEDIRQYNRQDYYTLLSAVFQDFSVMDATVAENVAQSREGIDLARVEDCLSKAGLTEFVASLPKGADTIVGRNVYLDGTLFSGGQTQRLMLARALYKNGPVLILDEPTAALDPLAESDIYQKYNSMTAGRTSIFISHRLASTRFCDRILFLADGRIAEEGTHETLLSRGGKYAELFDIQSRYYREGGDDHE